MPNVIKEYDEEKDYFFKIAKRLLEIKPKDEDIYEAKIKLAEELAHYDKVKNNEQIKALVDFLEYLFLIQDEELEKKYEKYSREKGGVFKMTIEELRKIHYKEEAKIEVAKNFLDIADDETIAKKTGLDIELIKKLRAEN